MYRSLAILALLVLSFATNRAQAALFDVGNGLINHPAADMTWSADGDLFATMAAANPNLVTQIVAAWTNGEMPVGNGTNHTLAPADFNATNGTMNLFGARAWVNYLNVTNHKGYSDWRLPEIGGWGGPGCGTPCGPDPVLFPIANSEWFRLFYQELGGTERVRLADSHNSNYSLFINIRNVYWGNETIGPTAHNFFDVGGQYRDQALFAYLHAWPVRTGLSVADPAPAPNITFSPGNLVYGEQPLGSISTVRAVTLRNVGNAVANIAGIATTGDFAVTHNCGATLALDATCVANVTFTPTDLLNRSGALNVNVGTVFSTKLSGIGGLSLTLSASATSVTVGESVTLTWSASAQAACEATGGAAGDGWTGPLNIAGSRVLTETVEAATSYGVRCTHDAQTLSAIERQVTVIHTLPAVTLNASSTNVTVGDAVSLTWASTNATACSASTNGGVWSGTKATSGSATINETAVGLITYTVTCTAATKSAQASIQVMNNQRQSPGGGGGGGGRFDHSLLVMLGLLWLWRSRFARRKE
jgi:hypothetical protein